MEKTSLINKKRLIGTFLEMVEINSPSFREGPMGDYLEGKLRPLGFRVVRQKYDGSFNILAFKKGPRKGTGPLILSGHMDTIEPTSGIRYTVRNGIIRSSGSTVLGADDKSAIAQIIEAVTAIGERRIPHGDIEIVLTSAEEKGLHGARNLDFRRIRGRHALVLDSSGPVGRIVVAAPSHITYEMQVTGRPAHAGIEPEKGISAIRVAAEIISGVKDGRIDGETTANIGTISGGTATNVVPKEVHIRGEVRSHNAATLKAVRNAVFLTARNVARRHGARLGIQEQKEYNSFRINPDDPFLAFAEEVFGSCGTKTEHVITGGGSDANVFSQHGILALNLSTGMQKVHSHEEFIAVEDLIRGALIVYAMVKDFPSFHGKKGKKQRERNDRGLCVFPFQRCIRSRSCDRHKGRICLRSS
jgi:tripeptide aminopeptidase